MCWTVPAMVCCLAVAAEKKHIVLVSGDDEYRSEEALPQLAKILEKHHGFRTTVLFAIDPADGAIRPDYQTNIPGLDALDSADLMVMGLRFRDLPDQQMKHIVDYIESGKPIVALRTSTHAFALKSSATYARYSWNSKDPQGGFGREVLGETWINHHGRHGAESTRGVIAPGQERHPILRGVRDIWGPTDVYTVRLPLPEGCVPLVLGQVLTGMNPTDPPVSGAKNDPMMPVAWTRLHRGARVFTTTMGAAEDLLSEGVRRMLVNACYWALGMESRIDGKRSVAMVGSYQPTHFGFGKYVKGRKPADYGVAAPAPTR
jgi:type 1 glutamine amidotransferase